MKSEFIEKYKDNIHFSRKNKSFEENANEIYDDTYGYPILVRFFVLDNGILTHVKEMYRVYLVDKFNNNILNIKRIQTVIICSLFDLSYLKMTTKILKKFPYYDATLELDNTIIKESKDEWKTIHPKWDLELINYLFSINNKKDSELVKCSFSNVLIIF